MSETPILPEQDEPIESIVMESNIPKATVESVQMALTKLREANGKKFSAALNATDDTEFKQIVDKLGLVQTKAYKIPDADLIGPSAATIYTNNENICIFIDPAEKIDPMDYVEHLRDLGGISLEDTRIIKFPKMRTITINSSPNIDRTEYEINNPKGITVPIDEILKIASK